MSLQFLITAFIVVIPPAELVALGARLALEKA